MSHEMEMEDFLRLKDAEIASLSGRLNRMTEALDDALGIVRGMQARKAELEAGL